MLIQRYHCNCYGYKEKGDCKSLTTKQMWLQTKKEIVKYQTDRKPKNNTTTNNKRKAKWDTTYLRAKDTVLYNRTAKTTVQLQHLENVKAIKNQFTIETTMDNITLMTVKEMKKWSAKNSSCK